MSRLSLESMRRYLDSSIASFNRNKLNGLLAEIDLRNYLSGLGYQDRVSPSGWVVRNVGPGVFAHETLVLFPEIIEADREYADKREFEEPPRPLHTICATLHQIGIRSLYCVPVVGTFDDPESVFWYATELGIPAESPFDPLFEKVEKFAVRKRRYGFLRYKSDTSIIPGTSIPEEFSKENLRVTFNEKYMLEISDIDGIFWGEQYTYPVEIKEKTVASDNKLGDYFGLDVGPFVKLAFYAAKKGNLHSLYIVREIDGIKGRNLAGWWFITFDRMAQYASWVPIGGGRNMRGGGSTVIKIPKAEFKPLSAENLEKL